MDQQPLAIVTHIGRDRAWRQRDSAGQDGNGEDFGVTSVDIQWKFEYSFNLSRASNLLRQLYGIRFLKRKLESFPSGGKRYVYFLTKKGLKRAEYIFLHTTEDFNIEHFLSYYQEFKKNWM